MRALLLLLLLLLSPCRSTHEKDAGSVPAFLAGETSAMPAVVRATEHLYTGNLVRAGKRLAAGSLCGAPADGRCFHTHIHTHIYIYIAVARVRAVSKRSRQEAPTCMADTTIQIVTWR